LMRVKRNQSHLFTHQLEKSLDKKVQMDQRVSLVETLEM
jgi:hypothetical protein